jgi:hypothetical protein
MSIAKVPVRAAVPPPPLRVSVDAEVYSSQSDPYADPADQCLCCRPLGHVFGYGVRVPSVTRPGINGQQQAGSVDDWVRDVLYPAYKREDGRKVIITLEVLPAEPDGGDGT